MERHAGEGIPDPCDTENKDVLRYTGFITQKVFMYARHKVAKPTVFIPVFPGTNCEYDSARAFERAGADTIVKVFKNLKCRGYPRFG